MKIGQALSARPDLLPQVRWHGGGLKLSTAAAQHTRAAELPCRPVSSHWTAFSLHDLTWVFRLLLLPTLPLSPQVYLEALSELQDRLPSFPNEIAWSVMEEELGQPVSEVYEQLSEAPVAAASLGQVYKGVLRETGDVVAVKVQRPGIGESIAVDMLLLRRLMGAVDRNLPQVSQPLVPLVDEFAARLFAELDYVAEGRNAEKFQVCARAQGSAEGRCRAIGSVPLPARFLHWMVLAGADRLAAPQVGVSELLCGCCSNALFPLRCPAVLPCCSHAVAVWPHATCAHAPHLLASHTAACADHGVD